MPNAYYVHDYRIHPSHYTHLISNPVSNPENGFSMIFTSPNRNNYNDRCYAFIIARRSGRTTLSAAAHYTNPIYSKARARVRYYKL